jgi:hypothetical protein
MSETRVRGPSSVPDAGGTTIGAGATAYLSWVAQRAKTELQNDSGDRWYIWYNVTAVGTRPWDRVIEDGEVHVIDHVEITSLAVKAVAATDLAAGVGQNGSIHGWL